MRDTGKMTILAEVRRQKCRRLVISSPRQLAAIYGSIGDTRFEKVLILLDFRDIRGHYQQDRTSSPLFRSQHFSRLMALTKRPR